MKTHEYIFSMLIGVTIGILIVLGVIFYADSRISKTEITLPYVAGPTTQLERMGAVRIK